MVYNASAHRHHLLSSQAPDLTWAFVYETISRCFPGLNPRMQEILVISCQSCMSADTQENLCVYGSWQCTSWLLAVVEVFWRQRHSFTARDNADLLGHQFHFPALSVSCVTSVIMTSLFVTNRKPLWIDSVGLVGEFSAQLRFFKHCMFAVGLLQKCKIIQIYR